MDIEIRRINGDEWRLWRSLRLRAVEESPDAFRSALAEESAEADESWRELIAQAAVDPRGLLLVAEVDLDPVGMMFGRIDEIGEILDVGALWVDPEVRRRGIGRQLIESALSWASGAGAGAAELWVTLGNDVAERLFVSVGFEVTSDIEPLRAGSELSVVRMLRTL